MTGERYRDLSAKVLDHFCDGYNCSQSVLLTMFEHWNGKSDLIPKIATPFGGGIGRCGSVCGALTGGLMAIGIRYGTNQPSEKKRAKAYKIAKKFYREFRKQNGSVLCKELIGCDLSRSKGLKKARETNVFQEKCEPILIRTVELLVDLI
jgi:C_GCAxxG_C_C family probable redox protein